MATLQPRCFTEIERESCLFRILLMQPRTHPPEYIILEQDHTQLDEIESIKVSMGFPQILRGGGA